MSGEDMRRFKAAYVAAFATWPDAWNTAKVNDPDIIAGITKDIEAFIGKFGIDIVCDAIRNMPWTKMSKPGLKDLYGPCMDRASKVSRPDSGVHCGFCNGYDFVQCFVDNHGMLMGNHGLPRHHVSPDAMPKLYPCPECQGYRYRGREMIKKAVLQHSQVYADRIERTDIVPVDDCDIPE